MEKVILTREWLLQIEDLINAIIKEQMDSFEGSNLLFNNTIKKGRWGMEEGNALISMRVRNILKVCEIGAMFGNDKGISTRIRVPNVATGYKWVSDEDTGFNVELICHYTGAKYEAIGMIIPLSEYAKVAKDTNYKIEIACSKGAGEFGVPFVVWYYNDSPKVKGKYKVPSLPLDIGSRNYGLHNVNKGLDSDPLMTLQGLSDPHWWFEVQELAAQAGNPDCIFDFWGDGGL